jgi:hypothetical protein
MSASRRIWWKTVGQVIVPIGPLLLYFYAALHLIDAYLASIGHHPQTHETRDGWISWTAILRPVYSHYSELRNRSEDARYQCRHF